MIPDYSRHATDPPRATCFGPVTLRPGDPTGRGATNAPYSLLSVTTGRTRATAVEGEVSAFVATPSAHFALARNCQQQHRTTRQRIVSRSAEPAICASSAASAYVPICASERPVVNLVLCVVLYYDDERGSAVLSMERAPRVITTHPQRWRATGVPTSTHPLRRRGPSGE
jgi:hypothetical protein